MLVANDEEEEKTSEPIQSHSPIVQQIYDAAHNCEAMLLQDLIAEYNRYNFDLAIKEVHLHCFNHLLVEIAGKFYNNIVLELLKLDVDINQYINFSIDEKLRNNLKTTAVAHAKLLKNPVNIKHKAICEVRARFIDYLVFIGNFELISMLGLQRFDLRDYAVNYVIERLIWTSIFCNGAIQQHKPELIQELQAKLQLIYAEDSSSRYCSSIVWNSNKIIQLYMQAITEPQKNQIWYRRQLWVDTILNIPLAGLGSNLRLTKGIDLEFSHLFATKLENDAEFNQYLSNYLWRYEPFLQLAIYSSPVILYVFTISMNLILNNQDLPGAYVSLAFCCPLMLVYATILAMLLLSISAQIFSLGKIHGLTTPAFTAMRAYTMHGLIDTAQAAPHIAPLTFAYQNRSRKNASPDIEAQIELSQISPSSSPVLQACV